MVSPEDEVPWYEFVERLQAARLGDRLEHVTYRGQPIPSHTAHQVGEFYLEYGGKNTIFIGDRHGM